MPSFTIVHLGANEDLHCAALVPFSARENGRSRNYSPDSCKDHTRPRPRIQIFQNTHQDCVSPRGRLGLHFPTEQRVSCLMDAVYCAVCPLLRKAFLMLPGRFHSFDLIDPDWSKRNLNRQNHRCPAKKRVYFQCYDRPNFRTRLTRLTDYDSCSRSGRWRPGEAARRGGHPVCSCSTAWGPAGCVCCPGCRRRSLLIVSRQRDRRGGRKETVAALADLVVLVGDLLTGGVGCLNEAPPHARAVALGLLPRPVAPVNVADNLPAPAHRNLRSLDCFSSRPGRVKDRRLARGLACLWSRGHGLVEDRQRRRGLLCGVAVADVSCRV